MSGFGTALDALVAERDKTQNKLDALNRAIAALSEDQEKLPRRHGPRPKAATAAASARPKRKRRPFSEETKAKMREAQRRRRAGEKSQPGSSAS